MSKNVGSTDKIIRLIVGALLVIGALMGYGAWMWIGVVPLVSGLLGNCPLYTLVGISTCPMDKT